MDFDREKYWFEKTCKLNQQVGTHLGFLQFLEEYIDLLELTPELIKKRVIRHLNENDSDRVKTSK